MTKWHNIEDPLQNIQKTSKLNNNYDQNTKKSKHSNHSYTSPFISSLNNNPHILKITCYNIVSFVNPTKQNQIIQEVLLNNINILGLFETNLSSVSTKFQKSHLPSNYTYFFTLAKYHKGSGVILCVKTLLADYIFYHTSNQGYYILIDLQLYNKQKLKIIQIYF